MAKPMVKSNGETAEAETRQVKSAVTAAEMGARQREISVSEFFTKNRHLLGFDNPRKALLTCVKEAVDNALDACEEAGILPEVIVKLEVAANGGSTPAPSQANRFRVTVIDYGPGIVRQQIPRDFRQAALRIEISSAAYEPRPARHRHFRRRHVRATHDRQTRADHFAHRRRGRRRTTSKSRSIPRKMSRVSSKKNRLSGRTIAAPR